MNKYSEPGNPDETEYPKSLDGETEWWHQMNEDEKYIEAQEMLNTMKEEANDE